MPVQLRLARTDQVLVREAIAYVGRRLFDPHVRTQVEGLEEDLDELLTGRDAGADANLMLDEARRRALRLVLAAYVSELTHPAADDSNRARAARLRALDRELARRGGWLARLTAWWPPRRKMKPRKPESTTRNDTGGRA
jgi:hypothetical protein